MTESRELAAARQAAARSQEVRKQAQAVAAALRTTTRRLYRQSTGTSGPIGVARSPGSLPGGGLTSDLDLPDAQEVPSPAPVQPPPDEVRLGLLGPVPIGRWPSSPPRRPAGLVTPTWRGSVP
jgi:hypothetical protein